MKEALLVATGGAAGALFRYFMLLLFLRFHISSIAAATLMWDTFSLAQTGSLLMALLNLGASFTIGLAAVGLGFLVSRAW